MKNVRVLKIWLAIFLVAMPMHSSAWADLSKTHLEEIKNSVALVLEVDQGDAKAYWGSGLVVHYPQSKPDCFYVLTNAHVIESDDDFELGATTNSPLPPDRLNISLNSRWLRNNTNIPVKSMALYGGNSGVDLALLEIEKKYVKSVPTAWTIESDAPLWGGTRVHHFGFPENTAFWKTRTWGVAVSSGDIQTHDYIYQHTNVAVGNPDIYFYVAPGADYGGSGGGVFDDSANWIGVLRGGADIISGPYKGLVYDEVIRPDIIAKFLGTKTEVNKPMLTIKKIYMTPVKCKYKDCWESASSFYSSHKSVWKQTGVVNHGNIHIVLSNGKDIQVTNSGTHLGEYGRDLFSSANSPYKERVDFDRAPKISPDKKTTGWTAGRHERCTDWSIGGTMFVNSQLMIWRDGRIIHTLSVPGTFIEAWRFSDDSKQVVVMSAWHHGPSAYRLFDVASGRLVATCKPWQDGNKMPSWAQSIENGSIAQQNADAMSLETAMKKFLNAIVKRDADAFLSLISRSKGLKEVDTINPSDPPMLTTYVQLSNDFRKKGGEYHFYFMGLGEGGTSFHYLIQEKDSTWKRVGSTFTFTVPGNRQGYPAVYVSWVRERNKWVIGKIGAPMN